MPPFARGEDVGEPEGGDTQGGKDALVRAGAGAEGGEGGGGEGGGGEREERGERERAERVGCALEAGEG